MVTFAQEGCLIRMFSKLDNSFTSSWPLQRQAALCVKSNGEVDGTRSRVTLTLIPHPRLLTSNACSPSPQPPWRPTNQTNSRSCRCRRQPLMSLVLVEGRLCSRRYFNHALTLATKCLWFHHPFRYRSRSRRSFC